LSVNPQLAGIKHLNRLEQVLASREWPGASYSEGIMMDSFGHIIEGTRSNVFFVRDGALVTPAIEGSGVAGVMREYLLDRAPELGLSATESLVCRADLTDFQEAFLCNSVFGIWPLISLDLATDDTLHWNPGGITLSLQQTVADRLGLKMNVENRR
jgi:4-amino-4-deoxychorismate lyase